jgi:ankyrin repeat protein
MKSSWTCDANGNARFRWAVCQLDTLGKCRNRANLRKALATLPPTLDKTYERILCAIAEEDAEYAVRVLLWLAFSGRPLAVEEVAEVIAIDVTRDPAFDREEVLEDPQDALDICSSLVTTATDNNNGYGRLESKRQIAVLAHYSVKEYLVSDRIQGGKAARYSMQAAACHSTIAKACLGYLGQFQKSEPMAENTLGEYQLARYSAAFWLNHVQKAGDRGAEMSRAALHLLSRENAAYLNWIRIHDIDRPWQDSKFERVIEETPNPLYYAALVGLEDLVRLLLDKGADVNAQGGGYGNALQAASWRGHEQVVKTLLDKGADVNAQGGVYGNALQAASWRGHEQVVKTLLDKGADVNAQGGGYGNALQAASEGGHEQVVKTLLDKGADVKAADQICRTTLLLAAENGNEAIVSLLVKERPDLFQMSEDSQPTLSQVVANELAAVVKSIQTQDKDQLNSNTLEHGYTPLLWAAAKGHERVVELLLQKGVDPDSKDRFGQSPLLWAAANGHEAVLQQLLAIDGVDLNSTDTHAGCGQTPLAWAAKKGHATVVRMLLAQDSVDVNCVDNRGRTPQLLAEEERHDAVLSVLRSCS